MFFDDMFGQLWTQNFHKILYMRFKDDFVSEVFGFTQKSQIAQKSARERALKSVVKAN